MHPNHSCFGVIKEQDFLVVTPLLLSLEKINSSFLLKGFRKDCRRFPEDPVSTNLSRVAAHSPVGQNLSSFCPEIITGGDEFSGFHLFAQLLDGLLELGWVSGSEVKPAKAEFHSFVHGQRQVEVSGSESRVPNKNLFAFCNQPGFLFSAEFVKS